MNVTFTTTKHGLIKAEVNQQARANARSLSLGQRNESSMVAQMQSLGTQSTGVLPPGVRWVSSSGRQVLFERPPRRARLQYSPKPANDNDPKWRDVEIELPWQVYAIVFSNDFQIRSLTTYAAQHQLTSFDDYLGLMPLPNTHQDGHFCLPASQPSAESLAEAIQNAYQMMWHSKFNMDVWDLMHQGLISARPRIMVAEPTVPTAPKASRLLKRWEELTRDEVLKIVDWPQMTTVGQVITGLNHYAMSSFTGMHLMSTAKQAFISAPGKEASRPEPGDALSEAHANVDAEMRQAVRVAEVLGINRAAEAAMADFVNYDDPQDGDDSPMPVEVVDDDDPFEDGPDEPVDVRPSPIEPMDFVARHPLPDVEAAVQAIARMSPQEMVNYLSRVEGDTPEAYINNMSAALLELVDLEDEDQTQEAIALAASIMTDAGVTPDQIVSGL